MTAGVMGVNDVEAVRSHKRGAQMVAWQIFTLRGSEQRRVFAREQERIVTTFNKAAMQAQRLPLSAAHFAPAIEMEDLHSETTLLRI